MIHIVNPSSESSADSTTDIDALTHMQFADSLIGYLDVRQWAFEKICTSPIGSELIDLRMYHYLYFTNLFGAIELVRDYLKNSDEKKAFDDHLQKSFPVSGDYLYVRELRNAMVHRGLDPVAGGVQQGQKTFAISPPVVFHRDGKTGYACSSQLLVKLAADCNVASNTAMLAVAVRSGWLDLAAYTINMTQTMESIARAEHMPEWVHDMAECAFKKMDQDAQSAKFAQYRVQRLGLLLGNTKNP